MKLLRDDLIFYPVDENQNYVIKDPLTDNTYEFGKREIFIIEALRKPYHKQVVINKFHAKFNEKIEESFVEELIFHLDEWNLLKGETRRSQNNDIEIELHHKIEKDKTEKKDWVNHFSIFCPQKLYDWIIEYFGFLRHLVPLVPIFLLIASLAFIKNLHLYEQDFSRLHLLFGRIDHIIFTLFTINLITVSVRGCTARFYNISTPSFGIMIVFGIIPRFHVPFQVKPNLEKAKKLWIYGASHLTRLSLISLGIFIWLGTRHLGTNLSTIGAALAFYSLISFLIFANPLLGTDGYRLLETYFETSKFRERAKKSLYYLFFKPPDVIARYRDDRILLRVYALLSITFIGSIIAVLGYSLALRLESNYKGFGVTIFIVFAIYIIGWFRMLSKKKDSLKQKKFAQKLEDKNQKNQSTVSKVFHNHNNKSNISGKTSSSEEKERKISLGKIFKRCLKLAIILGFIFVLFLPYRYDPGGEAVVSPILHQELFFDQKGIVSKVFFSGGEWIEQGAVIAEMDNSEQIAAINVLRAEINKKKEELEILYTTPSKEELYLAQLQVKDAEVQYQYSLRDFELIEELYNKNSITLVVYLDAKEKKDLHFQELEVKKANLEVIKNQVNIHQIESVNIEIEILQNELDLMLEQLERTKLRMPSNGKLITMNLKNLENKFLNYGDMFAEIEDSSHVQIEVSIPEGDANQIKLGDELLFKPYLHPTEAITGKVTGIYPVTESTSYGQVLKLVGIIPNENFKLKTGMTGHAKVKGEKMFVIQAFTRALISFVLIEFWSWLP